MGLEKSVHPKFDVISAHTTCNLTEIRTSNLCRQIPGALMTDTGTAGKFPNGKEFSSALIPTPEIFTFSIGPQVTTKEVEPTDTFPVPLLFWMMS